MSSLVVSPSAGWVYQTPILAQVPIVPNVKKVLWNWGDNTEDWSSSLSATHVYRYPGTYNITALVDTYGNNEILQNTYTGSCSVVYSVPDAIEFLNIPNELPLPGQRTTDTFKVSLTCSRINEPLFLTLHAQYSPSIPKEYVQDKWNFLVPTWHFQDKNGNWVKSLSVEPISILDEAGNTIGTKGVGEFYYIDDLSTSNNDGCPLLLTITLQTSGFTYEPEAQHFPYPSYANSEVARATTLWQVGDPIVSSLKITGNYLDEVHPIKWSGIPIPMMITTQADREGASVPELSYPPSNEIGNLYPITISLSGVPETYYQIDEPSKLKFQSTTDGFRSGGFVFTSITPLSAIENTCLVATASVYQNFNSTSSYDDDLVFPYPRGRALNPFVWVSNPDRGTINRVRVVTRRGIENCEGVQYYRNLGLLVEGETKSYRVPTLSAKADMMGLSGVGGIVSVAVDPKDLSLYAVDAELDQLYQFSKDGVLLKSLDLAGLYPVLSGSESFWFHNATEGTLLSGFSVLLDQNQETTIIWGTNQINDTFEINPIVADHVYFDTSNAICTPSYISLDADRNLWVSFYNNLHVVKLSADSWQLLHIVAPSSTNVDEYTGDYIYKPALVETDRLNNVWVAYNHTIQNRVIQLDPDGQVLDTIVLNDYDSPVALCVAANNTLYIACSRDETDSNSVVYHYDGSTLTALCSAFYRIHYMALNSDGDLWVLHGQRNLGFIEARTGNYQSWTLSNNFTPQISDPIDSTDEMYNESQLEGLTVDAQNRLWLVDSVQNKLASFWAQPSLVEAQEDKKVIKIRPDSIIGYFNDIETTETYTLSSEYFRSAIATGDWTGNHWYQKFAFGNNQLSQVMKLSACSAPFTVYPFEEPNAFRIHNETFDMSDYLHSLSLPMTLRDNPELFSKLKTLFGAGSALEDTSFGNLIYERIANFTDNVSDPDTAHISSLVSLQKMLSLDPELIKETDFSLPAPVQRALNILSIPRHRLCGSWYIDYTPMLSSDAGMEPYLSPVASISSGNLIVTCGAYPDASGVYSQTTSSQWDQIDGLGRFTYTGEWFFTYDGQDLFWSMEGGELLDLSSFMWNAGPNYDLIPNGTSPQITIVNEPPYEVLTAGDTIALRNKFAKPPKWTIETVPVLETENGTLTIYPLSALSLPSYATPITENYFVYRFYVNPMLFPRSSSKIDWDSPYTTLSPTLSTWNQWYGDHQLVDTYFNYLLTAGLFRS